MSFRLTARAEADLREFRSRQSPEIDELFGTAEPQ